jgi:hypothetical protein
MTRVRASSTTPAAQRSGCGVQSVHQFTLARTVQFRGRLSKEEARVLKAKRAHAEWHKKHAGHEKMHAEMLLVLLLTMVLTQVDRHTGHATHPHPHTRTHGEHLLGVAICLGYRATATQCYLVASEFPLLGMCGSLIEEASVL